MTRTSTSRSQVRVVVVEDHVLFAESLEAVLSIEGYDVCRIGIAEAVSAADLLSTLIRKRPRIVLLDLDLGHLGDGVRLIAPLAKAGIDVIVVTASSDRGRWGEAIRNGARTVLSKSRPLNTTLSAVRRVHHGLPTMSREEKEELLRAWQHSRTETRDVRARIGLLTARESQVLGHLMRGDGVQEIAAAGVVAEATVRTQVKSILAKLEVSSQVSAVGLAYQVDWRPPPIPTEAEIRERRRAGA